MSTTETIQTVYGDLEVELYECDSCGNLVREDDTVEFTIGDREGRACETCADIGPVDFPGLAQELWVRVVYVLLTPIVVPTMILLKGDSKGRDQLARSAIDSYIAGLLYGGISAYVIMEVVL